MRAEGEKGYSLLFFNASSQWLASTLTAILIIGISIAFYIVYGRISPDTAPDSIAGYSFAIAGTGFMLAAAIRFSKYRRSRERSIGKLNAVLNWHVAFGTIALVLLFLHSFGNFNPRSGSYALYGMIALAISGFIGRALDRLMPRLITEQVRKALTEEGEDRLESVSRRLQSIVSHNTREEIRGFQADPITGRMVSPNAQGSKNRNNRIADEAPALQSSWDLAYISMEETPQEVNRDNAQYRFVPDRKSALSRPGALIPGAQENMLEMKNIQQALKRETLFRYIIRYWRIFHIGLALLTIGLTLWHLEFAATLLLPVFFHF